MGIQGSFAIVVVVVVVAVVDATGTTCTVAVFTASIAVYELKSCCCCCSCSCCSCCALFFCCYSVYYTNDTKLEVIQCTLQYSYQLRHNYYNSYATFYNIIKTFLILLSICKREELSQLDKVSCSSVTMGFIRERRAYVVKGPFTLHDRFNNKGVLK